MRKFLFIITSIIGFIFVFLLAISGSKHTEAVQKAFSQTVRDVDKTEFI